MHLNFNKMTSNKEDAAEYLISNFMFDDNSRIFQINKCSEIGI